MILPDPNLIYLIWFRAKKGVAFPRYSTRYIGQNAANPCPDRYAGLLLYVAAGAI